MESQYFLPDQEPQTSTFHTISQGGEAVKKIELVSRITVNGEKREIPREEARDIIIKSQDKGLQAMSYEKRAAG